MQALIKEILVLLLITTVSLNIAHAKSQPPITVAIYLEPPYAKLQENKLQGINVDIIELFAKKLNRKINYLTCPFARCISLLKGGNADMIVGIKQSLEREKYLTFLEQPFHRQDFPLKFYLLKDSPVNITDYDDLAHLRIGTIRGALYFERFDNDKALNKVEVINYSQLIQLLIKGRIDTFLEREESINPWIDRKFYLNNIRLAKYQYGNSVDSYIAISKKSPLMDQLTLLNNTQQQLVDSGMIKAIYLKWHSQLTNQSIGKN